MRSSSNKHIVGIWLLFLILCSTYAQWVRTDGIWGGTSIAAIGDTFFVGADGIYRSTDNCRSWIKTTTDSLLSSDIVCLEVNGSTIFAGGGGLRGNGLFRSTDFGANWTTPDSSLMKLKVEAICVHNGIVYAGTSGGLFVSTDNGESWLQSTLKVSICALAINDSLFLAGEVYQTGGGNYPGYRIRRSTDNGVTWNYFNSGLKTEQFLKGFFRIPSVNCLAIKGNTVFAGISGFGVYRSTIDGTAWTDVLSTNRVQAFAVQGDLIVAATIGINDMGRIFHSTDNGKTWVNSLPITSDVKEVYDLLINNDTIYAATGNGIWYRPLAQMSTTVQKAPPGKAGNRSVFTVLPPSPSDRYMHLSFTLTRSDRVTTTSFGLEGTCKSTLINNYFSPGSYNIRLDTHTMVPGMYLIRVQSGSTFYSKRIPVVR